eukprot:175661-Amphidinium_carterae.1
MSSARPGERHAVAAGEMGTSPSFAAPQRPAVQQRRSGPRLSTQRYKIGSRPALRFSIDQSTQQRQNNQPLLLR